jgi:hypothetical protein
VTIHRAVPVIITQHLKLSTDFFHKNKLIISAFIKVVKDVKASYKMDTGGCSYVHKVARA